ncbi:MAG: lysophospholipid acyltransferase family protein [Gammaproteobacteria bacterium]|nr:lysophospholipid acyltransferase family protein [Gammaproteobacteria bacterium]
MRTLTWPRRWLYAIATPLLRALLRLLWSTYRIVKIEGQAYWETLAAQGKPFIPCYWHQHHFICAQYLRRLLSHGVKLGFLISPSVDGEVPARIAEHWGAQVIRGSTTRSGAQALRAMYQLIVKQSVCPVTTSDGPQGPLQVFKLGDILLAQLTQAPLLPMSYAADRYWQLRSWDRFIIPKPFARIAIDIGCAVTIPKGILAEDLEPQRLQLENTLKSLAHNASQQL